MVRKEIDGIDTTGGQAMAEGHIDDKPMRRLINQPKGAGVIAVDSGQQMQKESPAVAANAIQRMIAG